MGRLTDSTSRGGHEWRRVHETPSQSTATLGQDYAGSCGRRGAGGTKKASATAPAVSTQDHSTSERARIATVRSKEAPTFRAVAAAQGGRAPASLWSYLQAGSAQCSDLDRGLRASVRSQQKSSVKETPRTCKDPRCRWLAAARRIGAMTGGDATAIACRRCRWVQSGPDPGMKRTTLACTMVRGTSLSDGGPVEL